MPKKKTPLNDAKAETIKENIFLENPEGLPPTSIIEDNPIAIPVKPVMPEMRKAIFINGRDPGVALHFHYQSVTHPRKSYTLYHGYEHLLPLEIIQHLESCAEPIYGYRTGPGGLPESYIKSRKYIFQFKNVQAA